MCPNNCNNCLGTYCSVKFIETTKYCTGDCVNCEQRCFKFEDEED